MATDLDARKNEDEFDESLIEELKDGRTDTQSAVVDEDEAVAPERFELPGADLSGEELMVRCFPPRPMSSLSPRRLRADIGPSGRRLVPVHARDPFRRRAAMTCGVRLHKEGPRRSSRSALTGP